MDSNFTPIIWPEDIAPKEAFNYSNVKYVQRNLVSYGEKVIPKMLAKQYFKSETLREKKPSPNYQIIKLFLNF